jgi:hypothetical protein
MPTANETAQERWGGASAGEELLTVARGGNPPHDGGMEARVAKLEEHVGQLREDVATIKERITHMPTNADLLKVVSSAQWKIIGAIAALAIGAILKWAWPHLFP